MPDLRQDGLEHSYTCGRCNTEQYSAVNEACPVPCTICGYAHRDRKQYDVPNEVKLRLN